MSTTRKAPFLVATAALGLIAATAIVVYAASNSRSSGQPAGKGQPQQQQQQAGDRSVIEKHTSAMENAEEEGEEVLSLAAPPLAIAAAPAGFKALVVCAEGGEEATVAAAWASASRGAGAAVSVCPPGFLSSHAGASAGTYDSIVVEDGEKVSGAALGEVLKLLKAGGKVSVIVGSPADTTTTTTTTTAAAATKRALTFAGFIEVAPSPEDGRALVGKRAPWNAGASAPVRVSFRKPIPAPAPANGVVLSNGGGGGDRSVPVGQVLPAKKTWRLALDDDDDDDDEGEEGGGGMFGAGGGEEDDDLVDEDALLEGSAPVKRASETDAAGCATKRRACKDCSCGRAEMEEAGEGGGPPLPVASVADVDDALTSACGNCSKGDAFRCGGCPFLGKPTFEKGQEKLIMLSDLDSQQDD